MHSHPAAGESARHRIPERGFGLIELSVALVVLAIGVLGLAALIPMGTKSTAKSGQMTRGSELAAQLAEQLLDTPYGHADLANGNHQGPWPAAGGYYLSWVVEDDQPITACKRITIRVNWPKSSGPGRAQLVIVNPKANDL